MKIELKNILDVSQELQQEVRNWRNQENVKKFMYTDHSITQEEHNNWINSLKSNNKTKVFIVFINSQAEGIASINAINTTHKNAEWAFYLHDEDKRGGTGVLIEYTILNYVFDEMKIEKLNCEVLEINQAVIKLHQKFGFVQEGIRRKNIIKNGNRIDVYLLGITKEEWKEKKNNFNKVITKLSNGTSNT